MARYAFVILKLLDQPGKVPAEGLYQGRLQGSFFDLDTGKIARPNDSDLNISTADMLTKGGVKLLAGDDAMKFLGKFGKVLLHDMDKQTEVIMSRAAYKKGLAEEARKYIEKETMKKQPGKHISEMGMVAQLTSGGLPTSIQALIKNGEVKHYFFVGHFDARLGYIHLDGSDVTNEEVARITRGYAGQYMKDQGIETRVYPSIESALQAVASYGGDPRAVDVPSKEYLEREMADSARKAARQKEKEYREHGEKREAEWKAKEFAEQEKERKRLVKEGEQARAKAQKERERITTTMINPYQQKLAEAKARLEAIKAGQITPQEITLGKPVSGTFPSYPSARPAVSYQAVLDSALEAAFIKLIELLPQRGQPGYEHGGFYDTVVTGITFDARSKLGQEMRLFQSRNPRLVTYNKKERHNYYTYIEINFHQDPRIEKIMYKESRRGIPSKMEVDSYKAFVKIVQDARIPGSEEMEAKVIRTYCMD
jgi:hypothetical protein